LSNDSRWYHLITGSRSYRRVIHAESCGGTKLIEISRICIETLDFSRPASAAESVNLLGKESSYLEMIMAHRLLSFGMACHFYLLLRHWATHTTSG
jgi:hypothetical protein